MQRIRFAIDDSFAGEEGGWQGKVEYKYSETQRQI